MISPFARKPYQDVKYGTYTAENIRNLPEGNEGTLRLILYKLQGGELDSNIDLIPFLRSNDFDYRQYACQLFAHTCNNSQIHLFQNVIERDNLEPREARRIAARLGQTLSLSAIPLLFQIIDRFEGDIGEVNESVLAAINGLVPINDRDHLIKPHSRAQFLEKIESLDNDVYYYQGNPVSMVLVAEKCAHLINIAIIKNRPAAIYNCELILVNFSGTTCPIASGSKVTENDVDKLRQYINQVLAMNFSIGHKYFYGHQVKSAS